MSNLKALIYLSIPIAVVALLNSATQKPTLPLPKHHKGDGTFRNLYIPPQSENALSDSTKKKFSLLHWITGNDHRPKPKVLPIASGNEELWHEPEKATITWIGHSTFYLRWNNLGIITDPHFSDRASPVSWAGPHRGTPPGRALEALPSIDLVLLSHDHYDHLDLPSIRKIVSLYPSAHFIVPLKLGKAIRSEGAKNVTELDWWDEMEWNGFRIVCTPAHHWSKRTLFSKNTTLWSGWLIEKEGKKVWFSGDTGFGDGTIFKDLQLREQEIDLALIPIGAYLPRDFMLRQHVDPSQAVRIHQMVRAKRSIAHHWGNFVLSFEEVEEPPAELRRVLDSLKIDPSLFRAMQHGEIAPMGW